MIGTVSTKTYAIFHGVIYKKGVGIVWQFPTKSTTSIAPPSDAARTSYCPCQIRKETPSTNTVSVSSAGGKYKC